MRLEAPHAIGQQSGAVQHVPDYNGFEHVELKVSLGPGEGDSNVIPKDLGADHGEGLALGRIDLARHDGRARLVLRQLELAKAATGPGSQESDVLGDFEERRRQGVQRAVGLNDGVVRGERLELVRRRDEFVACQLADLGCNGFCEALERVDAGAYGRTALGEHPQMWESGFDSFDAVGKLLDISRKLLAKGQWRRVLQVGAANLNEVFELLALFVQRIPQACKCRQQLLFEVENDGDVHDGREGVVGGCRHVNVVIGMDWLLRTHLSTEYLDSPVRYNLVRIHIGLCA